ncbi:MAG: hypothetical protein H0T89_14705 [Deltaproteobacteria bacterium]|nr:hypothetical protein [Deltaproteobacteria bacterium]MDQ3298517.1 hypothetical protein [Myxococcota bacterium]
MRWVYWIVAIVLFAGALFLASRVQDSWSDPTDTDHRRAILELVGAMVLSAPLVMLARRRRPRFSD